MTDEETPYTHYALIADGEIVHEVPEIEIVPGPCVLSMKVWAEDVEQAVDMMCAFGNQAGFRIADTVEVMLTEPDQPPDDDPFAYDVRFSPYEGDEEESAEGQTIH